MVKRISSEKLIIAANQNIKERDYWLNKLSGRLIKTGFPYDNNRLDQGMDAVNFSFPGELSSRIMVISKGSDRKIHMILAAALVVLLEKYTNHKDILVGTPIYKQKIEGDFINTVLVLRTQLNGNESFRQLLLNIRGTVFEAMENRNYPVEILSSLLNMPFSRDNGSPLFDVAILLENIHDRKYLYSINCNMVFSFLRTGGGIEGLVEYNSARYYKASITRIISHFIQLLQVVLFDSDLKLSAASLLTVEEKQRILFEFNNTKKSVVRDKCYHQLFKDTAVKEPGRIVAVYNDQQISYSELDQEAQRIAHFLSEQGITTNSIVVLYLKRSITMLAAIIGVFKAGGAYLPLEVDWPENRIKYIIENSEAKIVITDAERFEILNRIETSTHFKNILASSPWGWLKTTTHSNTAEKQGKNSPADILAYIIYTSGTTGEPKGVMIHQLGMINHLYAKINDLSITAGDIIAQTASACFDISVWQFLAGLLKGSKTFIIDKEIVLESREFLQVLQRERVTILESVPSLIATFLETAAYEDESDKAINHLRWMILTGEPLGISIVKEWYRLYPGIPILNAYGPTEASDDVTHYIVEKVPSEDRNTIPVGKPLQNLHIYILDKNLSLCPIGVRGEICVAGIGVGKGYWKNIGETEHSFVPNPYLEEIGDMDLALLYKTGDVGYFREDGNIECLGRLDYQVKIRGNRIELGEIENQLLEHEDVKNAVVIDIDPGKQGDPGSEAGSIKLCAYLVSDKEIDITQLREYLTDKIPDYMIPSHFTQIEKIPLTPNGKIDRKALPAAELKTGGEYIPSQNEIEYKLTVIWSEILGMERENISTVDNFFQLGGHSLSANRLVLRIHKELNIKLLLVEIFKTQTIRKLAECIKEATKDEYLSIEPTEEKEYYPLSSVQKRLYFLQQMDKDSTAYNLPQAVLPEGELDKEKLAEVFKKLIERHESLRTSFETVNDELVQVINDNPDFEIEYFEAQDTGPGVEKIIDHFIKPFDLSHAPLVRVGLIETSEITHILMLDMHHIISDGVSHAVLVQDFMALYKEEDLPLLRLQYKDFSEWQESDKQKEARKEQKEYWLRVFEGEIPVLNIPIDYERPVVQSFEGRTLSFEIGSEKTKGLKSLAIKEGTTLYTILLAVFNVLLSKISGQEDIVIGAPVAGRMHAELEKIIGIFVNTLAMRNYPRIEKKFIDFLHSVNENVLKAFENQGYPFDELVEHAAVNRDISRNPLFDVVFLLQNMDIPEVEIPGLTLMPYEYDTKYSKFDLTLQGVETKDKLVFTFKYCTKLFKKESIERFISYFKKIVSSILNDIEQKISEIEIILEKEKKQLLFDFNNTKAGYPNDKTIHELFEEQVGRIPDHIALVGSWRYSLAVDKEAARKQGGLAPLSVNMSLTYKELNEKSNQLALLLAKKGVNTNTIAAIMVEPSIEMVLGIMAVLKTGGAYMPIDPDYPASRINYMLADSEAKLLVTTRILAEDDRKLEAWEDRKIFLEDFFDKTSVAKKPYLHPSPAPVTCLAYVIYTSGSTGNPKGVVVEHRSVVNLLKAMADFYPLEESGGYLLKTSYMFDVSVTELFSWFPGGRGGGGGRLVVMGKGGEKDPQMILDTIAAQRVTHINFVPSMFNVFVNMLNQNNIRKLSGLKYLFLAGEAIVPESVVEFRRLNSTVSTVQVENLYGPTEATVYASKYSLSWWEEKNNVPIGNPIQNVQLFVINKYNKLQAIGISGEMGISGVGLARGYLNNPELTNNSFSDNPFIPGERMYKTGDLARWLPGGNIEFFGRMDQQVKVRGFRIELGEIETQLLNHDEIKEAVVIAKEDNSGEKYLCAYIVTRKAQEQKISTDFSEIKKNLSENLPGYMIPSYFVELEKIPLTSNGKINRKALPEPEIAAGEDYIAPRNDLERKLTAIWSETLNVNKEVISINSNFFELGGHSLKATILTSKIHKELNVKVSLIKIFKTPTIFGLSEYIKTLEEDNYEAIKAIEKKEYCELSSAQKRLYVLQQMNPGSTGYNMPGTMYLEKEFDKDRLGKTFKELIKRHEGLRTSFEIIDEEPVQRIHENVKFEIEYHDARHTAHSVEGMGEGVIENFVKPFDLSNAPLFRVGLITTKENNILLIDMHHIISDGTSHEVLRGELHALYEGKGKELSKLRLQYKDYTEWQNSKKQQEKIKEQEEYWLKEFSTSDELIVLNLPTDYPRPVMQSFKGNSVSFALNGTETGIIKNIAKETGTTLYMAILAIYNVLFSKLSEQEDIIIGTPIAARRHEDLQRIIGIFINILALRNFPSGDKTFKEFLNEVKGRTLEAYENQEYQFEDLVDKLAIGRDSNRNPIFDVVFTLFNQAEYTEERIVHNKEDEYIHKRGISRFDITITGIDLGKSIYFTFLYSTKLFKPATIERFIKYFRKIIAVLGVNLNIKQKISDIEIISNEEKNQLLYNFNNTKTGYPKDKTIHELFEEQAERTPDHVALLGQIPDPISHIPNQYDIWLTYKELNQKSNQLAKLLRGKGIKPDTIVGIMVDRSLDMIISILGILKAGGAYLPINPDFPENRVASMLEDCKASILLTNSRNIKGYSFTRLQNLQVNEAKPLRTSMRTPIPDFDHLPMVNRSLINYEKYNKYIGHGMVKNSVTLQATRGCPYDCAFCCRVWPRKLVTRSAENIFAEVKLYYNMGIRRFVFIDDIFNFDIENSRRFFQLVIDNKLDIHILFPSGLRGDILTKEYIDLMIKAGTISFPLSLETASPRLQKLIKKNLNLKKFRENIEYIVEKYPHVILELNTMHGLPTETREEARMTLDFIKSLKYLHFPYVHILRIYSNTYMEKLALENGIPMEAILRSRHLFYHELPETLPFDKSFTLKYQAEFLNEYFLCKERLLHVLPWQMKVLTEDEMVQKYNSYLPTPIHCFSDLLEFVNIKEDELGVKEFVDEKNFFVPNLDKKMREYFPGVSSSKNALRVLLLDLSQYYSYESEMLYDVVEQPLGVMYLMTYLNRQFGEKINGKIGKSRLDFDSDEELKQLLGEFKPDVIGIRTLTMYRDFFHKTIARIRQWGIDVPIIAGGPYATSDYDTLLKDRNIDLAVLGEGEITFGEVIERIMENEGKLPDQQVLESIPGIAFIPGGKETSKELTREILLLDSIQGILSKESVDNLEYINRSSDLSYIAFTSGSTGKAKGVMVEHKNVSRLVKNTNYIDIQPEDIVLQLSNYAFDGSVFDIFGALLNGAALVMLKEDELLDVYKLSTVIKNEKITVFFLTTALFNVLVDTNIDFLEGTRNVLFGGENVSLQHVKKTLDYINISTDKIIDKIIHVYGPTETTVYATYYYIRRIDESLGTVPIGEPLSNTTAYILDKNMKPVPIGVAGEIFIGGEGVARGYLNSEELTKEKFVLNPFVKNDRLYKTGDLARWLPDGNIEFLDRIDNQVKLRGFRIELGEIEAELLTLGEITEALVLAREGITKDKYLCAYVVLKSDITSIDFSEIKRKLSENLPDFMIPSFFVQLGEIPLTSNGKVDRKALPVPEIAAGEDYIAPRNDIERKLAAIWSEVLNVRKEAISIDSNFFELGGHSLKATILTSKIHKELNVKVPLPELFMTQTIIGLSEYIKNSQQEMYVSIKLAEKKEYYGLSSAQKRLYILQQMDFEGIGYNIPETVYLDKDINIDRLVKIFNQLIRRHESIRTSFETVNEEPVQRVHENVKFEIEYYEPGCSNTLQASYPMPHASIIENFVRPFDLSKAPLLRVGLISTRTTENHILLIDMHHIISDATSHEVLREEFQALCNGKELSELRLQYKDYAEWQNSPKHQQKIKKQEEYWLKEFFDELPVLNLQADYIRPAVQSFEGNTLRFALSENEIEKIKNIATETGATVYMVIVAIYTILLSKLSGQEDIIIGTPIAARRHAELQPIIGMFVNTLALRNFPSGNKTFNEFLVEVKERTLEAFENQEYQFEDLVEKVTVKRDASRNPLFDVMFSMHDIAVDEDERKDMSKTEIPRQDQKPHQYENIHRISKFDLTLGAIVGESLYFSFEYCTKLFKKETIDRFISYFKKIVATVITVSEKKIGEIEMVSKEERKQVLYDFNKTEQQYPEGKTIHRLFEEQVEKTPEKVAVVGKEKSVPLSYASITYRELNKKSNQLARVLIKKGVIPDSIVGIIVEPSIEMVVAMMAILKAGGVYLPIDSKYPEERNKWMMEDSGVKILLIQANLMDKNKNLLQSLSTENVIYVDDERLYSGESVNLDINNKPGNLGYAMYTSGSTGKPKGVVVQHGSAVNVLNWFGKTFNLGIGIHVLQLTDYTFDPSVEDILGSLLHGATLYVADRDLVANRYDFCQFINENQIHIINFVPTVLKELLCHEQKLESLRFVIAGGEKLEDSVKNRIIEKGYRLYNNYGPVETTVDALAGECSAEKVSLGKPIANAKCYILDKYNNTAPVGITGELCIAGTGVARGYVNMPEHTHEKFIDNPFIEGEKMFRTGDLARFLYNGNVEFLGRIDQQVKIRGFRIELGEIEHRLLEIDYIRESVVIDKQDGRGDKYLCAYVVSQKEVKAFELRNFLSSRLPDYMIPAYFVQLDRIPLTPNGKLDRRLLPGFEASSCKVCTAPGDVVEKRLLEIWSEVLGRDASHIGIYDNFFELGGHSLKATILTSKIHKELNVKITLAEIFRNPTIRGMGKYIRSTALHKYAAIEAAEEKEFYSLSYNQRRLWIIHQHNLESPSYHLPGMIELKDKVDIEIVKNVLSTIIKRHESFRTYFKVVDNEPVQFVLEEIEIPIKMIDISSIDTEEKANNRRQIFIEAARTSFDLTKAPLLRSVLVKVDEDNYDFVFNMHHIISDGWSMEILKREFTLLYKSFREGKQDEVNLKPLERRYTDFAQWQNSLSSDPELKKRSHLFWQEKIENGLPILQLPLDYKEKKTGMGSGSYRFVVNQAITRKLEQLAEDNKTSIYMVILSALNILLSRVSGQQDILMGILGAGREDILLQGIVGFFVNTLVINVQVDYQQHYLDFLQGVNSELMSVIEHQDYPLELVLEDLKMRFPDIPVLFNMFNLDEDTAKKDLEVLEPKHIDEVQDVKFDMVIYAARYKNGIEIHCNYRKGLFKKEKVEYMMQQFDRILERIGQNPHQPLKKYVFKKREKKFERIREIAREM